MDSENDVTKGLKHLYRIMMGGDMNRYRPVKNSRYKRPIDIIVEELGGKKEYGRIIICLMEERNGHKTIVVHLEAIK